MKNGLLRNARKGKNWTQGRLAEEIGASEDAIRNWEAGRRSPSLEYRYRLCKVFDMSASDLGLEPEAEKDDKTSPFPQPAQPPPQPQKRKREDQNRRRMLKRVSNRWMTILEHSLYQKVFLDLSFFQKPDALMNPWESIDSGTMMPLQSLPSDGQVIDAYDKSDGALFILGAPGAGKTILLLELARQLIEQASTEETHPLPVVFHLSSWAEKQLSLNEWLREELNTKYQVPPKLGQAWVTANKILPLLDGLDEIAEPSHRIACISAINAYRKENGFVPMVVCSRYDEYFSLPARLLLNQAIVIQPLTMQQIEAYIKQIGSDLAVLQSALQHDPGLQEIASTPLMLNTLTVVYQGLQNDETLAVGSPLMRRKLVFAKYVERMLERRTPKKIYTTEQIKQYLGWLAWQMQRYNQTEFYVERMQPDWLEGHRERHHYRIVIRLITTIECLVSGGIVAWLKGGLKNGVVGSGNGILGLFGGGSGNSMLGWMAPGIGGGNQGGASLIIILAIVVPLVTLLVGSPSLPTITLQGIRHGLFEGLRVGLKAGILTSGLAIPFFSFLGGIQHGLHYGLGIGFFVGIAMGLMRGLVSGSHAQQAPQAKLSFPDQFVDALFFGASGGLSFMMVELLLQVSRQSTLIYSAVAALFFFLAYGFGGGNRLFSIGQTIEPAEIVTWSWTHMLHDIGNTCQKSALVALATLLSVSTAIGIVSSLFFSDIGYGLHYGLVFGTISGLIVGVAGILTSMLKSGWSSNILPEDKHIIPNEGISRSGRHALISACIFAPIGGLVSGIASGIGFGLIGGLSTWPVMGMAFALMFAIVFFLVFAIAHGGIAWIQHYTLRWYLWRAGCLPMKYVDFLNTVSKYGLTRNIGGGYIFAHRLLLEYFADIHRHPSQNQGKDS
jgi:transcriptional regulator with XRE-family HTH domain